MAAGLKIREENIADFQNAFENVIQRMSPSEDLAPTLKIDAKLDLDTISNSLINELEGLMPFGTENPEPLFMTDDVMVVSSKIVGKNHRRIILRQLSAPNSPVYQAIQFNVNSRDSNVQNFTKMVFKLRWNRWKGNKTAQLVVEDLQWYQDETMKNVIVKGFNGCNNRHQTFFLAIPSLNYYYVLTLQVA